MNALKIKDFKCFVDVKIPLNKLTIMAGANGNGKSSVIQALLYLRRTIEHCGEWIDGQYELNKMNGMNVPLNGVYCLALGDSSFVLNRTNFWSNTLGIGLSNETDNIFVTYVIDDKNPKLYLTPEEPSRTEKVDFSVFKHEFYYLNAERIGPRVNQPLQFFDYPNAGWQGETTAQLIAMESGYYKIEEDRKIEPLKSDYLLDNVNFWLNFIMPGVKIRTVKIDSSSQSAQIILENHFTSVEPTLATNLGFGISYILPIIATGLIAKKGTMFIIENPEAHLHPSAQSKMGVFLAMVANSGVEVIVETHSDHVINGIQIAVAEKRINNEDVTINFFSHNEKSQQPDVDSISIKDKGKLTDWPKGFFDQSQIDYSTLLKLSRDV